MATRAASEVCRSRILLPSKLWFISLKRGILSLFLEHCSLFQVAGNIARKALKRQVFPSPGAVD